MINSTSLVLVLQIGKARLLLPGDAEWGTWKRILDNAAARALVHGATFFKVGHHGSHNATSKTLVEKVLPRKIPAMVSTQQGPGKYRNNIPLADLMEALKEHDIHYARSDQGDGQPPKGFNKGEEAKWIDLARASLLIHFRLVLETAVHVRDPSGEMPASMPTCQCLPGARSNLETS
jgi:hypothetical protein